MAEPFLDKVSQANQLESDTQSIPPTNRLSPAPTPQTWGQQLANDMTVNTARTAIQPAVNLVTGGVLPGLNALYQKTTGGVGYGKTQMDINAAIESLDPYKGMSATQRIGNLVRNGISTAAMVMGPAELGLAGKIMYNTVAGAALSSAIDGLGKGVGPVAAKISIGNKTLPQIGQDTSNFINQPTASNSPQQFVQEAVKTAPSAILAYLGSRAPKGNTTGAMPFNKAEAIREGQINGSVISSPPTEYTLITYPSAGSEVPTTPEGVSVPQTGGVSPLQTFRDTITRNTTTPQEYAKYQSALKQQSDIANKFPEGYNSYRGNQSAFIASTLKDRLNTAQNSLGMLYAHEGIGPDAYNMAKTAIAQVNASAFDHAGNIILPAAQKALTDISSMGGTYRPIDDILGGITAPISVKDVNIGGAMSVPIDDINMNRAMGIASNTVPVTAPGPLNIAEPIDFAKRVALGGVKDLGNYGAYGAMMGKNPLQAYVPTVGQGSSAGMRTINAYLIDKNKTKE